MYCKKCGGKLESYASNCAFCGEPVEKYDTKPKYIRQEKEKEVGPHMSVGKWIGLVLLNGLPGIGQLIYLILMFKWAFGSTQDLTLKNYAKANLLMILIVAILIGALVSLVIFGILTMPKLNPLE